ncbi:FtsQ-type POTRA domain-containing protein [Gluconobacter japonicus]|uniref:FtsQ-type POTRA domain-containing protein n=1 Tax=Gluconobacter japonicus TaxID=376620 RepID=UPI0024AD57B5|nr:FtsQ-type POTRA domain-containing protein [Gluconobacter japonicus]MDI6653238.1 FtsQ-type POTRA domain-containing protein [Gluconobacter japonicus]
MMFFRSMLKQAASGLGLGAILLVGSAAADTATPPAPPPVPAMDAPLRLGTVSVQGNKNVPSEDILKTFGYQSGQSVTRAQLSAAQKRVADLYQSRGVGTDLGEQMHISADKVDVKLVLREEVPRDHEARKLILDKVAFDGNSSVPTPALAAATHLQEGATISDETLAADEAAIQKVYQEKKLGAEIQPQVVYPNHDNHLVLVWQIKESEGERTPY